MLTLKNGRAPFVELGLCLKTFTTEADAITLAAQLVAQSYPGRWDLDWGKAAVTSIRVEPWATRIDITVPIIGIMSVRAVKAEPSPITLIVGECFRCGAATALQSDLHSRCQSGVCDGLYLPSDRGSC